ncbi:MAG: ATP-binding protein [Myxococcota bacterium]|nr:ATP-binding protein [Myxococcota bacterium]
MNKIFIAITQPHDSLTNPIQRRIARMVAAFHLLTAPLAPMFLLLGDTMGLGNGLTNKQMALIFVLGLVDYGLVRSRWFVIGVWAPIIVIGFMAPYLLHALPEQSSTIFILFVGLILAGIWVSMKELLVISTLYTFIAIYISVNTNPISGGTLMLWLICTVLMIILRSHLTWSHAIHEQGLKTHNNRLISLLNATFDGTAIAQSGTFSEVSEVFAKLLESRAEQLLGQSPKDILPPQMLQNMSDNRLGLATVLNTNGFIRYIQFVSQSGKDSEEQIFAIRDVTQQQLQQAELQTTDRMVSAGFVAAGVAHEVNTPLMIIQSEVDLLQHSSQLPKHIGTRLEHIESGIARISDIMSDLKRFTRPSGSPTTADVNALIESTLRLAQHTIGHKSNVTLELDQCPSAAISESKLSQVLLNLLLNAAQAKSPQKSQCSITVKTTYEGDDHLIIDIIDDGIGIPDSQQHVIFEPFFTTKPKEGTGLGLSICQRILTACGGHIQLIHSSVDGSHFQIKLPTAIVSSSSEIHIASQPPNDKRILVIDDNFQILELLKELLQPNSVECRTTIQSAHDALEKSDFDIILCDLVMPNEDGRSLYHHLKSAGELENYHFAFITGGGVDMATQQFLENAQVPVVFKPFRIQQLWDALELEAPPLLEAQ